MSRSQGRGKSRNRAREGEVIVVELSLRVGSAGWVRYHGGPWRGMQDGTA